MSHFPSLEPQIQIPVLEQGAETGTYPAHIGHTIKTMQPPSTRPTAAHTQEEQPDTARQAAHTQADNNTAGLAQLHAQAHPTGTPMTTLATQGEDPRDAHLAPQAPRGPQDQEAQAAITPRTTYLAGPEETSPQAPRAPRDRQDHLDHQVSKITPPAAKTRTTAYPGNVFSGSYETLKTPSCPNHLSTAIPSHT